MTHDDAETADAQQAVDADQPLFADVPQDLLLSQLVAWADMGLDIGVTLFVGGRAITGMMTSGEGFITYVKEAIEERLDKVVTQEMSETFDAFLSHYRTHGSPTFPAYIHLKDAKFMENSVWSPRAAS